jgi:hypothetical protein
MQELDDMHDDDYQDDPAKQSHFKQVYARNPGLPALAHVEACHAEACQSQKSCFPKRSRYGECYDLSDAPVRNRGRH